MKLQLLLTLAFAALLLHAADDPLPRRRAFRQEIRATPSAVMRYLKDPDPEIRQYALYLHFKAAPEAALPRMRAALQDSEERIRLMAVQALTALLPKHPEIRADLDKAAREDASLEVRNAAGNASWPFRRTVRLLRNDPNWDHEVTLLKRIDLPRDGWKFQTDPEQNGHWRKLYAPDFDDRGWKTISLLHWEKQGFPDYDGIAWYRIEFTAPAKPDCNAIEIHFGGVDESAWVWLNGIYLGAHNRGTAGWNIPFAVDATREIKWGAANQLTVRVLDRAQAGGIYKPVWLEILK